MTERIVVVLPDPFGPRKPTTSPSPTVSDTSSRATVAPNRFETLRTSSMRRNLPASLTDKRPPAARGDGDVGSIAPDNYITSSDPGRAMAMSGQ